MPMPGNLFNHQPLLDVMTVFIMRVNAFAAYRAAIVILSSMTLPSSMILTSMIATLTITAIQPHNLH
jgi:hypothetical protein